MARALWSACVRGGTRRRPRQAAQLALAAIQQEEQTLYEELQQTSGPAAQPPRVQQLQRAIQGANVGGPLPEDVVALLGQVAVLVSGRPTGQEAA